MTEPTLSARVAELERTLAGVTRERDELREGAAEEMRQRDHYREMWQAAERESDQLAGWKRSAMEVIAEWDKVWEAAGKPGPLGSSKALNTLRVVTTAERRATEAARSFADVLNKRWSMRISDDGKHELTLRFLSDEDADAAWEALARMRREYPAVPPEREGAGTNDSAHVPPTWFCECGHQRYDHSFDSHGRLLCVANGGRCECKNFRPTTPQAAPEPKCVWCRHGNGGGEYGLCAECRTIIRDCVRDALAVETGRRASGREE